MFYSARFFHNRAARWFTEAVWKAPPQDQTVAFQTSRVQLGTAAIKAITFTEICMFSPTVVLSKPAPKTQNYKRKKAETWTRALQTRQSCSKGRRPNVIIVPIAVSQTSLYSEISSGSLVWFVRWTGNVLGHGRTFRAPVSLSYCCTHFHQTNRRFSRIVFAIKPFIRQRSPERRKKPTYRLHGSCHIVVPLRLLGQLGFLHQLLAVHHVGCVRRGSVCLGAN